MALNSETAALNARGTSLEPFLHAQADATIHESTRLMMAISRAAKRIAATLRRAGIDDVLGSAGETNVQGEDQQKLDVIANDIMIAELRACPGVAVLGSEEDEALIHVGTADPGLAVFFDPLDGSSNLDVGGGVGTIFSIFRAEGDTLRPGSRQIAAGYVLYAASTILVFSFGSAVYMFVLDDAAGEFLLSDPNMRIPARGKIYSVNEGNRDEFPGAYVRYLDRCHERHDSQRYAAAMVADVHRVLLKGGVFLYPPNEKSPNGKLRLMYEANPMGFVVAAAGGAASTGSQPIMDVVPEALHQRVPVILGSPENVNELLGLFD